MRRVITQEIKDEINKSGHPIEIGINFRKIKYSVLNKLFEHNIPENIDTVNLFVNLSNLFSSLYTDDMKKVFSTINKEEKYMISSQILNFIAHYRHYFASRKSLYTNFYFYYSFEKCTDNININEHYKENYYKIHDTNGDNVELNAINNIIKQNVAICEIISKYIPHVYFINTHDKDPSIVPYHFLTKPENEDSFSIICSNDDVSLINLLYNKKNFMLTLAGDNSKLIGYHDIYQYLTRKKPIDFSIDEILLPYVIAITGYKKYSVDGLYLWGYNRTLNNLYEAIKEKKISEINYVSPDLFIEDFKNYKKIKSPKQLNTIQDNINILDPKRQYDRLQDFEIEKIFDLVDLIDKKSLMAINNRYYTKFPIHIEELMEGEEYE
jgi:hypothetical protein